MVGLLDASPIDAAVAHVMDPDNYPGLDQDQRSDVASALQVEWNRSRQASERLQREADNNFQTALINRSLGGEDLLAWKDPKTGISPSQDVFREGIQWLACGAGPSSSNGGPQGAISPPQSDPDTLTQLTGDITGGRLPDSVPINRAFMQGEITDADRQNLSDLQSAAADPSRSRWLDYATSAFGARYADPNAPNGVNAEAMKLFPSFMFDLNDAIRDQDLKGTQVRDATNKMLDDTQRLYLASNAPDPQPDTASDAGGVAAPAQAQDLPEADTTKSPLPAQTPDTSESDAKNPPPDDTNTSTNANADTNVVDSNGKPDQLAANAEGGNDDIPGWPGSRSDAASQGRPLTEEEKGVLKKWYSEEDLNNARVHEDGLPPLVQAYDSLAKGEISAITLYNDIYFKPGEYKPGTAAGLALLGHELLHLQRYREGMTYPDYLWSARNGYDNSKYEIEAKKREEEIKNALEDRFKK